MVRETHDIVLHLSGTLDGLERDALSACIDTSLAEGPRRLVLELSGLEQVDAAGLAAVRAAADRAGDADVELVLQNPPSAVRAAVAGCVTRFR